MNQRGEAWRRLCQSSCVSRLLRYLLCVVLLVPAVALASQEQWVIHTIEQFPGRQELYYLSNEVNGKNLRYDERRWGVNLGWTEAEPYGVIFKSKEGPNRALHYGEAVAMFVLKQPYEYSHDDKRRAYRFRGDYLVYDERSHGINLGWHERPRYEWQIDGGTPGTRVKGGDRVALYNTAVRRYVVYGSRGQGINLVWLNPVAPVESSKGSGESAEMKVGRFTFDRQAPYVGTVYYLPSLTVAGAKIQTVKNPNLGIGKQWIVQIIKPGVSSNACGLAGKTVNLAPGQSTGELKGWSLDGRGWLGFCLSSNDQFTLGQGPPPHWTLEITYVR